jgi:hypothetical protein
MLLLLTCLLVHTDVGTMRLLLPTNDLYLHLLYSQDSETSSQTFGGVTLCEVSIVFPAYFEMLRSWITKIRSDAKQLKVRYSR